MGKLKSIILALAFDLIFAASLQAADGYKTTFVDLGHQSAVLYQPVLKVEKSSIGIVVMHSDDDYLGFCANSELSKRGYTVLATLPAKGKNMEPKLLNIKAAVDYLRQDPNIRKVVLLGHSGGATVMTAYQLLAEQGLKALSGKIYTDYSTKVANLPKADGMLLLDANWGNSLMALMSLDPNITGQGCGMNVAKKLDLADVAVGYNPNGSSNYTEAFRKAFNQGQRDRLMNLMASASARLSAIKAGKGEFSDDEPFVVAGGCQIRPFNKLFPQDLQLMAHTKEAWPVIKADGSVKVEIARSVRAPMKPDATSESLAAAEVTTVRGYLSSCAITVGEDFRVREDRIDGVQWNSNINTPVGNVEGITVPLMCMGMTGSWEYLASESIYAHSASKDKSLGFVEGASHMFWPDNDAELYNHTKYGDTVKHLFDYVDRWLEAKGRFL